MRTLAEEQAAQEFTEDVFGSAPQFPRRGEGRDEEEGENKTPPPSPLLEIADSVSQGEIPCYGRAVSHSVVRFPVVDA